MTLTTPVFLVCLQDHILNFITDGNQKISDDAHASPAVVEMMRDVKERGLLARPWEKHTCKLYGGYISAGSYEK